LESIKLILLP